VAGFFYDPHLTSLTFFPIFVALSLLHPFELLFLLSRVSLGKALIEPYN